MIGRPASGRARKRSMSLPRSATNSGSGVEEGRQAGLDMLGDFLGSAILGITESARAREALVAAGNVIREMRERGAGHHRLVRRNLDQIVLGIDVQVLGGG